MSKTAFIRAAADERPSPASTSARAAGPFGFVARRFANWLGRRRIARIEDLDDRVLADIGLTRSDVVWARRLPLDHNPIEALRLVADERRLLRLEQMRAHAQTLAL